MKFYMAPMEGLTTYIYRNAYHIYFKPMDKYVTPFIVASEQRTMSHREISDILPEHNQGMEVVPQLLTNHAGAFIKSATTIMEMGYKEVNLNLGCPSGTVVAKGRGAGFLTELDKLEQFLDEIFAWGKLEISMKTRIGRYEPEEFEEILNLYNKYPVKELIIHPRVQQDFYSNIPNWKVYGEALQNSKNPVCYNGDIFTVESYHAVMKQYPDTENVMLGRGVLNNPWLREEIENPDCKHDMRKWKEFHDKILSDYQEVLSGDRNVLFKMKELWTYFLPLFPMKEKIAKKIRKAQKVEEYKSIVNTLFYT